MDLTAAGFGGTLTGALPELQAMAESLMIDTGKAERQTSETAQDPDTGTVAPIMTTLFADEPCKIQMRQVTSLAAEAGGRTVVTQRLELHLSVSTEDLRYGDIWTLTAVGPRSRSRVGRKVKILGPADKTLQTALRYEVEEMLT